jgi:Uma2 family endonuclease
MKPVEQASTQVSERSEPQPPSTSQAEEFFIPPEFMPRYNDLITEDDAPVDNLFSEKQMRLLTEPLYASWRPEHPRYEGRFLALSNVGLFYADHEPALVPDVMLSLGVEAPKGDLGKKENRSYFIWHFGGKPPEVVIEIVSNLKGGELSEKMEKYATPAHIPYYVVYDPFGYYSDATPLRVFANSGWEYVALDIAEITVLQRIGLGLRLWHGEYEGVDTRWLRWCLPDGTLVATGKERADAEHQRADSERQRADSERQRAESAEARAEALTAKLRALGIEP